MHFRVVVSVSEGLDLALMTDKDRGRAQILITQLRSFAFPDVLSQTMPRVSFATCTSYFMQLKWHTMCDQSVDKRPPSAVSVSSLLLTTQ